MTASHTGWTGRLRRLALAVAGLAAVGIAGGIGDAAAQTAIKVGKAVPNAFSFTPLDIGIEKGIFAKHGLEVEAIGFQGGSPQQQALAAGSIQFALGAGPEFQAMAKGAPNIGIGQMAGRPLLLGIVVRPDGPAGPEDLKGKMISVSGKGSLTHWLVGELARQQGWDSEDINTVGLGAMPSQLAALKAGQTDGMTVDLATGYRLEEEGEGRVLVAFGEIIDNFIMHMIWGNKDYVAAHPDVTKAFLAGWYETIKYVKENKQESLEIAAPIMGVNMEIASKVYDDMLPMFNDEGTIDRKALDRLAESFVEMGSLPEKVDLTPYFTEEYLP